MKKNILKKEIKILQKKCEVLGLLLKLQTIKIESLKEENLKLQRLKSGILPNKH